LGLKALELDLADDTNQITSLGLDDINKSNLEAFRMQRPRFSWMDKHLFTSINKENQLKIQGEFENHTLLIRFPNSGDGLSDLFMIYFKNEDHVFTISSKKQKLSTELKKSLASVYVRSLDTIKKQIESDSEIHQIIGSFTKQNQSIDEEKSEAAKTFKSEQIKFYKSVAERFTKKIDKHKEYSIKWSYESIEYLVTNYNDIEELEKIIERALIIAINSSLSNEIIILPSYLKSFDSRKNRINKEEIPIRYQRTYSILDRYEEAALLVIKNKTSLTGAHLGESLNPSISAAAISDAIRKHSSKIIHLLQSHPGRWKAIRSHFRPIQNKLINQDRLDQLAS
jgi:hypothetical protein